MISFEDARAAFDGLTDADRAGLVDILAAGCRRCGWPLLATAFGGAARAMRARGSVDGMVLAASRGAAGRDDVAEAVYGWDLARYELQGVAAAMQADARVTVQHLGRRVEWRLCL